MSAIQNPYLTQNPGASDISFTSGEAIGSRLTALGTVTLITGDVLFTYFTAQRTETVNDVTTFTGGTGSSGLTYAAAGVYAVDAAGDLTQVAASASAATLWNNTFSVYAAPMAAGFQKVAGMKYAVGLLAVGTGMPVLSGWNPPGALLVADTPVIASALTGQATLPASVPAGSLSSSTYFGAAQAVLSPTTTP